MGRKSLGWSAIILGIFGIVVFAMLLVATLLMRGAADDWADEILEPAGESIERLAVRLAETDRHTDSVKEEVAELVATGSDRLLSAAHTEVVQLQVDLMALEASVMSVNSGMEIIAAFPMFAEERRGFKEAVRQELVALRGELARVEARLLDGQRLAAEVRAGGEGAEKARGALKALAREVAPLIATVQGFLNEVGRALLEVKRRLGEATDRIGRGLTIATVVLGFLFAWLALAHFCVYLAGKRLLEEEAAMTPGAGGDSVPPLPNSV